MKDTLATSARAAVARCLLALLPVAWAATGHAAPRYLPRDGDIVFQTSRSAQSLAIQRATHSRWSHMGIVYLDRGRPCVYEAVQPVRLTRFAAWQLRGEGGHLVVKRLREADRLLTPANLARMKAVGRQFEGRNYDPYFEWSDRRVYCSELVWKVYHRALGVNLGALQTLGEFDLTAPAVRKKIDERWHGRPPLRERVISPRAIFESDRLITVYER